VWLVATKLDDPRHEEQAPMFEAYGLGFGEIPHQRRARPRHLGAARGDRGGAAPDPEEEDTADEAPIRIAIVGARTSASRASSTRCWARSG
jgi:hypothetical protein